MRKAIVIVLLAIASRNAIAEWIEVGSNDINIVYADPATIHTATSTVKMWTLYDFRNAQVAQGKRFMSAKAQTEYDCMKERVRLLSLSFHSENMAGGDTVRSDSGPSGWENIPPDSGTEMMWRLACGKR